MQLIISKHRHFLFSWSHGCDCHNKISHGGQGELLIKTLLLFIFYICNMYVEEFQDQKLNQTLTNSSARCYRAGHFYAELSLYLFTAWLDAGAGP